MRLSKLALLFGVLLAVLAGCKSSRLAVTGEKEEVPEQKALLQSVQEGVLEFHTLSARLNAGLRQPNGKKFDSRVELKMVRDSIIQLSIQPLLGIEVFRVELTADTVRLIDRMGKRYVEERYSGLLEEAPFEFNFYNLQALFINRVFLPGMADLTPESYGRFRMSGDTGYTDFSATDGSRLSYTFHIDREAKLASTEISDAGGQFLLTWTYDSFRAFGQRIFPMKMKADIVIKGKAAGGVELDYSRIQLDKELRFNTSSLKKYKRVTMAEIQKMLKK